MPKTSERDRLNNAFRLPVASGPRATTERMTFLSALELDQRQRAGTVEIRLPEISFTKRRLPGEPNTQFGPWEQERRK
jgi:hypothetical protein